MPHTQFWTQIVPFFSDCLHTLTKKMAIILASGIGVGGNDIVDDTAGHEGEWFVFHAIADCVIASMTFRSGSSTGSLAGKTIKAGDRIFGIINAVQLTSGVAILYRHAGR